MFKCRIWRALTNYLVLQFLTQSWHIVRPRIPKVSWTSSRQFSPCIISPWNVLCRYSSFSSARIPKEWKHTAWAFSMCASERHLGCSSALCVFTAVQPQQASHFWYMILKEQQQQNEQIFQECVYKSSLNTDPLPLGKYLGMNSWAMWWT